MSKTISGSIAGPITLVSGDNPVLVDSTGHVYGVQIGIYGNASAAWSITNQGTIAATATNASLPNAAILFENGGSVSNASNGLITSDGPGVFIGGVAGTVSNDGSISGTGDIDGSGIVMTDGGVVDNTGAITGYFGGVYLGHYGSGTVTNTGTITGGTANGVGVVILDGGTVVNGTAAATASTATIYGGIFGVEVEGSTGTVTNYGTIAAGTDSYSSFGGVGLQNGGTVTNAVSAQITGYTYGVYISGNGAVMNAGTINALGTYPYGGIGVFIDNNGTIINGSSGETSVASIYGQAYGVVIRGVASVVNYGTIATGTIANYCYDGVLIGGGGSVTNALGALISGYGVGVYVGMFEGTVINSGTITGIAGASEPGEGIDLTAGGEVDNAAAAAAITGSFNGIYITGTTGTVSNAGVITALAPSNGGNVSSVGVRLNAGGSVSNAAGGSIYGYAKGVVFTYIAYGLGSVVNYGSIAAHSNNGVELDAGGTVINGSSGSGAGSATISGGAYGVWIKFAYAPAPNVTGTLTNYGTIIGTTVAGVELDSGGLLTNAAGAQISGAYGVVMTASGSVASTLINAGTISATGPSTIAVEFGAGNDLLVVEHGAVFNGYVMAFGTNAIIELAGSVAAPVTASYNALGLGGFTDALFGAGGNSTLEVANTTGTLGIVVSGFTLASDVVDLTAIGTDGTISNYDTVNHLLTVTGSLGEVTVQLDTSDASAFATQSDGTTGTNLTLCFVAGTRILTDTGEVPVEHLQAGDRVVTHSGVQRCITWIGTGRVLATRGRRNAATPVIVRRGALADNVPQRDLRITKGHALYLDGALIPIEELVNHRSILWDDRAQEVELYHVELETHDVLIADGAPAESYRDDGNRWLFRNANSGWNLPPQTPCAPILTSGPIVDAIWQRLLERALPRPGIPTTEDADVHLRIDGQRVDAWSRHATAASSVYRYRLPGPPTTMRIVSSAATPMELGTARDPRQLGVAVRQIEFWQGRRLAVVAADDPALTDGFHRLGIGEDFRWTDGNATVPPALLRDLNGPLEVVLHVAVTTLYRDDGQELSAA